MGANTNVPLTWTISSFLALAEKAGSNFFLLSLVIYFIFFSFFFLGFFLFGRNNKKNHVISRRSGHGIWVH